MRLRIIIAACAVALALVAFIIQAAAQTQPDRIEIVLPSSTATAKAAATIGPTPAPSPKPTPALTPQPTIDPTTWGAKFSDKFTNGDVIQTDSSYRSAHVSVTVNMVHKDNLTYYVTDIYLTDLKYFKTAFGHDSFDNGAQTTLAIAQNNDAIIAINGDYCSYNKGPVLRNGVLYRDQNYKDVLVMYDDGTMETFLSDEFDMAAAQSKGAYQIWTFGPMLLNDGQPMTEFNSSLGKRNPRTAIGYYEPGHYCFVVVDGRQSSYSQGITLTDLSQLFYDLGCKAAFNLDGGQTSEMVYMGQFVNQPYNGGRAVSDIIYLADDQTVPIQ